MKMQPAADNHSKIFYLLFSSALFLSSVYALTLEISPFTSGLNSPIQRFSYLENGIGGPSLSIHGQKMLMNDCLESFAGPTGMAQPTPRRHEMLKSCQTIAETLVLESPSFAFAWLIAAFSSAELKQFDNFNAQLVASQSMAPNEQWLAEIRVNLAEENLARLNPLAMSGHERDLSLLVQSRLGVASIASRYVNYPAFNERITAIVEKLSVDDQKRFVENVRAAARIIVQRRKTD